MEPAVAISDPFAFYTQNWPNIYGLSHQTLGTVNAPLFPVAGQTNNLMSAAQAAGPSQPSDQSYQPSNSGPGSTQPTQNDFTNQPLPAGNGRSIDPAILSWLSGNPAMMASLAGGALGLPLGGPVQALGSVGNTYVANDLLQQYGLPRSLGFGAGLSDFFNNISLGLLGTSANQQAQNLTAPVDYSWMLAQSGNPTPQQASWDEMNRQLQQYSDQNYGGSTANDVEQSPAGIPQDWADMIGQLNQYSIDNYGEGYW